MTFHDEGTGVGEAVGVAVRSGVHEVELRKRLLRPCYFPANCHRVLRGSWFAEKGSEWVPLRVRALHAAAAAAAPATRCYPCLLWTPAPAPSPPLDEGVRKLAPWWFEPCIALPLAPCQAKSKLPLCGPTLGMQESLAEQLEEGYRQALWLPSKGRLALQQANPPFYAGGEPRTLCCAGRMLPLVAGCASPVAVRTTLVLLWCAL